MTDNPINPIDSIERLAGHGAPPLRRPYHRRLVAGVAAGIAEYFAVDVAVVRVALVVLGLLGGVGVPAYLAAWLLIPDEGAPVSIAEEWLHHRHQAAA
ncbi:MAG TPA: PspC domain-containing protein [Acidimicrobiales bacterium]|nr:PspC domain-containing protein [Acidimicrobiales bacterium]